VIVSIGRRPIVSKNRQQRPQEIAGSKRQDVPADRIGGDAIEFGEDQGVGKEDGVVEERLGCHQAQADQGTLPLLPQQRASDLAPGRVGPGDQPNPRERPLGKVVSLPAQALLDRRDDGLRLRRPAMGHEPARALGNPQAHEEDDDAQGRADAKSRPPAQIRAKQRRVEQDDRSGCADGRPHPEAAVDHEVGPPAHARRHQLLDGGVDGGVLAADARARGKSEQHEAPEAPGERSCRGGGEIDCKRYEKELLATEPIGQAAEEERAEDRTCEVGAGGEARCRCC
jgi:hypothetical protein